MLKFRKFRFVFSDSPNTIASKVLAREKYKKRPDQQGPSRWVDPIDKHCEFNNWGKHWATPTIKLGRGAASGGQEGSDEPHAFY